jgi:beta-lactam-binding protein with PASTA domain
VLEIEDETLCFLNESPKTIIAHLHSRGGTLDFADTIKLIEERDSEWDGTEVPQVNFNHITKAMEQLQRAGINSDLNDKERDSEWDGTEVPQVNFNRITKAMEQLQRAGINSDLNERRDKVLFYLKNTGEYDPAVREWENKPAATKTWMNIKTFMSTK